jgi:glycosyltransferase involved in cell wall biosynthesis
LLLPLVTVVIPTLNRSEKLTRALHSVAEQQFDDLAVIVVDDGSEEDIAAVTAAFPALDIRLLRHDSPQGAQKARNDGWRAAESPYIAFLDSDDIWLPDKLSLQMAAFEKAGPGCGLVYTWFSGIGMTEPDIPNKSLEIDRHDLLVSNIIGNFSIVVVRRDLLEQVDGLDEAFAACQDWELWVRLAAVTRIRCVPKVLAQLDDQGERITGNVAASLAGHRLFSRKFATDLKTLPRPLQARHHLKMARVYFFRRSLGDWLAACWRAIKAKPSSLFRIASFLCARIAKRAKRH